MIEWDALKIAMQHPLLVGVAFDELDDHDFTHPWLAAVRAGMAKAGGPAAAPPGEAWVVAVRDAIGNDPAAAVVSALAVDPLRLGREPDEQYAQALLARLQELTCARRIQDLKSKLQRTNPIDRADDYNKMFGELIALEAYRADLRKKAISGRFLSRCRSGVTRAGRLAPETFGEVLGVGKAERAGDLREHHRRRGQAEQRKTGPRRIEVGRELAGGLSLAEVGEHARDRRERPPVPGRPSRRRRLRGPAAGADRAVPSPPERTRQRPRPGGCRPGDGGAPACQRSATAR